MDVFPIPAFNDNYLWTLVEGCDAVIVDPGDAAPVRAALDGRGLRLRAILVTHHHGDHVGGIAALRQAHEVPVYGPRAEAGTIGRLTELLAEGDEVTVLGRRFGVIEVPGHTRGHIAYFSPGLLFCGDTLFSAGCGRLFEGTPAEMHRSLCRLASLPDDSAVYCTHEYTAANLAFAAAVEPDNVDIAAHRREVAALRAAGRPSLPSTIALERRINPFLRCELPAVRASAERHAGMPLEQPVEVFRVLRQWKDGFRAPAV